MPCITQIQSESRVEYKRNIRSLWKQKGQLKGKRYHIDKKNLKGLRYGSSWENVAKGVDLGDNKDIELP